MCAIEISNRLFSKVAKVNINFLNEKSRSMILSNLCKKISTRSCRLTYIKDVPIKTEPRIKFHVCKKPPNRTKKATNKKSGELKSALFLNCHYRQRGVILLAVVFLVDIIIKNKNTNSQKKTNNKNSSSSYYH